MSQSFADKDTEELFYSEKNRRFNAIARVALRKLIQMNQALRGDLDGYHFIRINNQWRIVFQWTDSGPERVAIIDYH